MFCSTIVPKLQLRSLFWSLFLFAQNCKQGVCIDSSCSRLDTNQNISKGDIYATSRAKSIVTLAARCADSSGCFGGCFFFSFSFFLEEKNPIPPPRMKALHFFCTHLWLLHITAWWNVKWNALRTVSFFSHLWVSAWSHRTSGWMKDVNETAPRTSVSLSFQLGNCRRRHGCRLPQRRQRRDQNKEMWSEWKINQRARHILPLHEIIVDTQELHSPNHSGLCSPLPCSHMKGKPMQPMQLFRRLLLSLMGNKKKVCHMCKLLAVLKDGQSFKYQKGGRHGSTKDMHSIVWPTGAAKAGCK